MRAHPGTSQYPNFVPGWNMNPQSVGRPEVIQEFIPSTGADGLLAGGKGSFPDLLELGVLAGQRHWPLLASLGSLFLH